MYSSGGSSLECDSCEFENNSPEDVLSGGSSYTYDSTVDLSCSGSVCEEK